MPSSLLGQYFCLCSRNDGFLQWSGMLGVKSVSEVSPCATQEFTKKSHKKEKVLASVVELQSHSAAETRRWTAGFSET